MSNDSFWIVCDENKQNCHCDWRVTIVDCIERQTMLYIYVINAIWSLLICIIGSGVIYHRVFIKKLPIFDFNPPNGFFIRPKPIESMLFFGLIFNILRIIDAILLITDAANNVVFRAFLYELPWQFGICAFACYLFGIAHTVSSSSKVFGSISVKIDLLCTIMIALPFLTNNVCSIAAAVYAEKGDFIKAKIFTDALYYLWTVYCFTLACWILYSGLKLTSLLEQHLRNQKEDNPNTALTQKVKNGLFKVRMVMTISITSLFVFSFIKCAYGAMRTTLLKNNALNLAIASVWTYDGTLASMLVVMTVIFNPKALASLSLSSSSQNNSTYYQNGTRSNLKMYNNPTDSRIVDNDDATFASMAKSGIELKESYYSSNIYYEQEVASKNDRNPYLYGQTRQSEDIASINNMNHYNSHQSSTSKIHLVSPSQ